MDHAASISPDIIERFVAIVGDRYAIRDEADLYPYLHENRGLWFGKTPLVLRPGSVEEVSRILKLATETRTAIVPQGGNTGLVGGQIPHMTGDEIVLSLSRLNRIREIDTLSDTITVDAGVVLDDLHKAADSVGRIYPLTLGSQGSCQIGGNLSSNAGEPPCLPIGNARELCLGVEVVLPTGEVLDDLRKLKKDNTGYDLKNLFVGAEGTLGIITGAVLKLYPKPKGVEAAWVGLSTPEEALSFFRMATERAGTALTTFELITETIVDFAVRHVRGVVRPLETIYPWYVMMEVSSGRSADDARELIEHILSDAYEAGVIADAALAANLAQRNAFWFIRESMTLGQEPEGASIKHDVSVPVSKIPELIERGAAAVQSVSPGARLVAFGHMGDGNLHFNVSQPAGIPRQDFIALDPRMHKSVHDVVRSLNGSISAEHGIGQLKRKELLETAPPVAIDLMRRVKAAFDPAGIMNPGKVI